MTDAEAGRDDNANTGDGAANPPPAPARGTEGGRARRPTLHPLAELTLARLREFWREPEAIFWVFIFPVLLACALGIAFRNTGPEQVRVAVEDGREATTRIAAALARSPDVVPVVLAPADAARALRSGNVALVVRPADTGEETATGQSEAPSSGNQGGSVAAYPSMVYRYDPTRPESRTARLAVEDALRRAAGHVEGANARDETVTEPGARYIDFLIPGLIGLNLMGSGMWGVGFGVVSARTRKLLKRFAATPMRRSHYLLALICSRLVFLGPEVAALVVFARLVFGVIVHGSLVSVAVCALAGAFSFSGLGLLVASRPRTIEGVSGLMNFVMLPMWLLSGTFFSAARFPAFLRPFIKALPLTALNDALRAVMNDGAPLAGQWPQLAILLAWGLLSFVAALRVFRWQ